MKKRRRHGGKYKTGTHVSPKGGTCEYRSSWELLYMKFLDEDPHVVSYKYEQVIVPYISNVNSGMIKRYYPDFLVEYDDGRSVLVEIKPTNKLTNRLVMKKLVAAEQWCKEHNATLDVVTEVELKGWGLL